MRCVAIVEDHLLLAETLRAALARTGFDAQVIAPDAPARLLPTLLELNPELTLLDLDLGEFGDSSGLIAPLVAAGIRVLVVTGSTDLMRIAAALEHGAIGYQLKDAGFQALLDRTNEALAVDGVLDPAGRSELLAGLHRHRAEQEREWAPFERLTARERDTLVCLADGRSVSDISRDWVVSEATIRTHVRSLLKKLDVPSQLAAVALALRTGWLDDQR